MKKTTVRFATVGLVLVVGALAIALAQHDARQRPREAPQHIEVASTEPEVISMPEVEPVWTPSSSPTMVRANNDGIETNSEKQSSRTSYLGGRARATLASTDATSSNSTAPSNSLRSFDPSLPTEPNASDVNDSALAALSFPSNFGVVTASGEGAVPLPTESQGGGVTPASDVQGLPALPSLAGPPGSASGSTNPSSLGNLSLPNTGAAASGPSAMLTPPSVNSINMPLVPQSGTNDLATPRSPLPSTASNPATQPVNGNGISMGAARPLPSTGTSTSFSDVQRSPMAATNLQSPAALPAASSLPSTLTSAPPSQPASAPNSLSAPSMTPTPSMPLTSAPGQTPLGSPATGSSNAQGGMNPNSGPASWVNAPSGVNGSQSGTSSLSNPTPSRLSNQPSSFGNGPSTPSYSGGTNPGQLGRPAMGDTRSSLASTSLVSSLVSRQPGSSFLEGSQNPIMVIHKRAPDEIQVGKKATFVITVRNSGSTTAHDVTVTDSVPEKCAFAESMPECQPNGDGLLVWKLGEMAPGDERVINVQLVPQSQGEIGSVATVHFAAQASVRTVATSPKLEITYTAMPNVLISDMYSIDVVVKNSGTGVAKGAALEADIPAQLKHECGDSQLKADLGILAPNETKRIRLDLRAIDAGKGLCAIRALTDDGVQHEERIPVEVMAPKLAMSMTGPARRFVDRQAAFTLKIANQGTAAAINCEIMVRLPPGLNFNGANNKGEYNAAQHAVYWSLPELPAGKEGDVELMVRPVEPGVQKLVAQASADLGAQAEARADLAVEEQGELTFTIQDDNDPVEMTASTIYTVDVRNRGMRSDRDVRLAVQLPPGSQVLKVDAAPKYSISGDQLVFEPIPQMDSKASQIFRFEVKHAQPGTQIVRATLTSQNRPTPVSNQEATEVYDDRR